VKKQDPTITGPTAWQGGGTNSGQSTMTTNASGLTLNAIDQLLVGFYKLPSEDLKALSTKLKNAGYPVRVTSKPTNDLKDQYIKANVDFGSTYSRLYPGSKFTDYLTTISDSGAGGVGGSRVSKSVRLSDPTTAEALVTAVMQDQVGRGPSKAELKKYTQALQRAQTAAPTTTVTTSRAGATTSPITGEVTSGATTSKTTGGINEQQFLINEISGTDEAKAQKVKSFYDVFKQAIGVS
jgi:hypothetical protein